MKKLLTLFLGCSLAINAIAQLENDPAIIAFYPFNGNGNDISGNGFNATLNGPSNYSNDRNGNSNSAFSFDGSSNYFTINNVNSTFKPTQFPVSISTWIRIPQNYQGVFTFFKNDFAQNIYSGIRGTVISSGVITIGLENGGPIGSGSRRTKTGTTNIKDGQWHLITCVIRGFSNMDIFVDCHNDGGAYSGGANTLFYGAQNSGIIGAYDGVLGNTGLDYALGDIDQLIFIGRELTLSEIQTLYFNQTASITGETVICPNSSTTLTAHGGTSYLWDNGSTDAQRIISNTGIYHVTVLNNGSCSRDLYVEVTQANVSPLLISANTPTSFCLGGSVQLNVNADGGFHWNDGSTQNPRTVSSTGDYYVTANEGCTNVSNSIHVQVYDNPAQPTITPSGPLSFIQGGSVVLSSSSAAAYLWNPGSQSSAQIEVTTTGDFSVQITNEHGCHATSQAVHVSVLPDVPPVNSSCTAVEVMSYNPKKRNDGTFLLPSRTISSKALGLAQNSDSPSTEELFNAVALGFGGDITVRMSGKIANGLGTDFKVFETTFNPDAGNCSRYPERIQAYASQDNCHWVYLGDGCQDAEFDLGELNWAEYIRLVDISPIDAAYNNQVADGYDVDGIECLHGYTDSPIVQDLGADYATQLVSANQLLRKNGTAVTLARSDASKALGAPQYTNSINFFSLGFGGSITLKLGYAVFNKDGNDLKVVETSFGNPVCDNYPEKANVEVSLNGSDWFDLGQICLDGGVDFLTQGVNVAQYVRITDHSASSNFNAAADGYDVDGIVVLQPGCSNTNTSARITDDIWTKDETAMISVNQSFTKDFATLQIQTSDVAEKMTIELISITGQKINTIQLSLDANSTSQQSIDLSSLSSGIYMVSVKSSTGIETFKLIKQ